MLLHKLMEKESRTFYLKQGVRQGCSLSPILFALYLKDMGESLHRSRIGTTIGKGMRENPQGVTISAMFFVDDLILIAETRKGLEKLLTILNNE